MNFDVVLSFLVAFSKNEFAFLAINLINGLIRENDGSSSEYFSSGGAEMLNAASRQAPSATTQ